MSATRPTNPSPNTPLPTSHQPSPQGSSVIGSALSSLSWIPSTLLSAASGAFTGIGRAISLIPPASPDLPAPQPTPASAEPLLRRPAVPASSAVSSSLPTTPSVYGLLALHRWQAQQDALRLQAQQQARSIRSTEVPADPITFCAFFLFHLTSFWFEV